ncbi:uncharacterized protein LOC133539704 [Nerophis ophidion]|uniref:uncharacterized protein LOC133539704 n=1 Tax=Nerophis ophidion TaxID=159077 RepID=UPI002AE0009F|nr:uncharacterized protein LOC133539704 [Nerophis ophidion]
MAFWRQCVLAALLLTGLAREVARVRYQTSAPCAVRGSTLAVGCTFTPLMAVVRAVWCVDHLICHGSTPSVYDSARPRPGSRYQYLGDLEGNCTLVIHDVRKTDNGVLRFRMEAADSIGHFTGITGVKVNVIDEAQMVVLSSARPRVTEGDKVILSCACRCSFQQLEVRWFRDGHALVESGPTLQLGPLTTGESGNYTCALARDTGTTSLPFSLNVEAHKSDSLDGLLAPILGGTFGLLLVLLSSILIIFIVKRNWRKASAENVKGPDGEMEHSSNLPSPAERAGPDRQEMSHSTEEVSYASVQFKQKTVSRPAMDSGDFVVYSAVASAL